MEKFILKFSKNIVRRSLLATSAVFLTVACAPAEIEVLNGLNPYAYVQGNFSEKSDQTLTGTGVVRFVEILPAVQSSRAVYLRAELGETLGQSSVSLVMNSSNVSLPSNNGVVVRFQRSGINVLATVSVNGNVSQVSTVRTGLLFPAALDVVIEVHNDFNGTRVLVWRRDVQDYTTVNADIDTARTGDMVTPIPIGMGGPGVYMGLRLENARVTAAKIEASQAL